MSMDIVADEAPRAAAPVAAAPYRRTLKQRRLELAIVAIMIAAAIVFGGGGKIGFGHSSLKYAIQAAQSLFLAAIAGFLAILVMALFVRNPAGPFAEVSRRVKAFCDSGIAGRAAIEVAILGMFMGAFLVFKMRIPHGAIGWDAEFAALDALMLGGAPAWKTLHPLLGSPPVTRLLDFAYTLWIPFVFVFWAAISSVRGIDPALARQYRLATLFAWIVAGVGLASAFASLGPVFAERARLAFAPDYAPLFAYLENLAGGRLGAMMTADMLWNIHTGAWNGPGGISAMPSMHNLQAALFAIAAFRIDRRLGFAMTTYAAAIFAGSIHLGWHYMVDGLAGLALAPVFWWAAGKIPGLPAR